MALKFTLIDKNTGEQGYWSSVCVGWTQFSCPEYVIHEQFNLNTTIEDVECRLYIKDISGMAEWLDNVSQYPNDKQVYSKSDLTFEDVRGLYSTLSSLHMQLVRSSIFGSLLHTDENGEEYLEIDMSGKHYARNCMSCAVLRYAYEKGPAFSAYLYEIYKKGLQAKVDPTVLLAGFALWRPYGPKSHTTFEDPGSWKGSLGKKGKGWEVLTTIMHSETGGVFPKDIAYRALQQAPLNAHARMQLHDKVRSVEDAYKFYTGEGE